MWLAFKEVLSDLWYFANGISLSTKPNVKMAAVEPNPRKEALLPRSETEDTGNPKLSSAKDNQLLGYPVYVLTEKTDIFCVPELGFDIKITTVNYGQTLQLIRQKGDYAEVQFMTYHGWVSMANVTDDREQVCPMFRPMYCYDNKNEHTTRLRECIKDEMLGGVLSIALQSAEFVLYKLWENKRQISWNNYRPRIAGAWQTALRGALGVNIGIEPHTGAILECAGSGQSAFLGYVESVHPDSSIVLHSIGRVKEGEFRAEHLTRDVWKEWRPVFITFT